MRTRMCVCFWGWAKTSQKGPNKYLLPDFHCLQAPVEGRHLGPQNAKMLLEHCKKSKLTKNGPQRYLVAGWNKGREETEICAKILRGAN